MPLTLKVWVQKFSNKRLWLLVYILDNSGYRIIAAKDIPENTLIVSCPAGLIITPETSQKSVLEILGNISNLIKKTLHWVERQWIATYLSLHWIIEKHQRRVLPDYLEST